MNTRLCMTVAALVALLSACTRQSETPAEPVLDQITEYTTKTGKTIIVTETHPISRSLSTITVSTRDFEHNYSETFEDMDPIGEVLVADLDGNGFDEIYLVTVSQGSGSYGSVIGFSSNKDKSLSMIHIPGFKPDDPLFAGYMGHDTFTIEGAHLVRTYPLFNDHDTNSSPSGGEKRIFYELFPGEAAWQLMPSGSERNK